MRHEGDGDSDGDHDGGVVMINVFTTEPRTQAHVLAVLAEVTERVTSRAPGFLSATLHASLDGTRVVNCARWTSRAAYEALLRDPAAAAELDQMKSRMKAQADPNLYTVHRRIEAKP